MRPPPDQGEVSKSDSGVTRIETSFVPDLKRETLKKTSLRARLIQTLQKNVYENKTQDTDYQYLQIVQRGPKYPSTSFLQFPFSRSVMSDSLQPHEPQHARPPCPSPTPGV